jgi:hypothetical protein
VSDEVVGQALVDLDRLYRADGIDDQAFLEYRALLVSRTAAASL